MKRLIYWLGKWEYTWLCLLVVIILALHFSVIKIPDKTVFDEVHYITDARGVISGSETVRGEHPPLGKLFVIAGMLIFGDNPLGWRFFSVILGTISIVLFYLICRNLSMSKRASFLATFLLANISDEAKRKEQEKTRIAEMQWGLDMQMRESTQKFIDPRDTRPFLIRALRWLRNRKQEWAPRKHENIRI